ncbi:NAD-dependent protein deacylase [Limnohabitans sp.]|uniref:SIR2 family NAD-dependent protein deacylase n=1 Tax=Limnohabitans sp. TaxID=1907725 RepID=UPI0025C58A05|nr:NAD-dependent protein deacylase [Limnohabitans sp.]
MPVQKTTIAQALLQARRIVVFTGAGMSAESGIATFRNAPDSLWAKFNTREMATRQGWRDNKERVWAWYEGRRGAVMQTEPHGGHVAIAQLASVLKARHGHSVQLDVVTQNVDNLHERAGSANVIHLHGSLFAPRCMACDEPGELAPGMPDPTLMALPPPRCQHCQGYLRPGVVWFGEEMPQTEFRQAEDLVDACDAMLVVGTSGVVWPAAELPINAHHLGKFVAEINPEPSELAKYMRVQWPTSAAQGLPQLLDVLRAG